MLLICLGCLSIGVLIGVVLALMLFSEVVEEDNTNCT